MKEKKGDRIKRILIRSQRLLKNPLLITCYMSFRLFVGTCTLILGRHLGFLKPDSSSTLTTRLAEAVRIHFTASRDAFYGLPLWKLLPTSAYKQLIESEDTIYKCVMCNCFCNCFSAVTLNNRFLHSCCRKKILNHYF